MYSIVWSIWLARNDVVFNVAELDVDQVVELVKDCVWVQKLQFLTYEEVRLILHSYVSHIYKREKIIK